MNEAMRPPSELSEIAKTPQFKKLGSIMAEWCGSENNPEFVLRFESKDIPTLTVILESDSAVATFSLKFKGDLLPELEGNRDG